MDQARFERIHMSSTIRRSRLHGDAADAAAILSSFAGSPSWFVYPESAKKSIHKKTLLQFRALFKSLHGLQPNLSFTQKIMERAVELNQREEWHLSAEEAISQKQVVAKRFRAACRHLPQALLRKHPLGLAKSIIGASMGGTT